MPARSKRSTEATALSIPERKAATLWLPPPTTYVFDIVRFESKFFQHPARGVITRPTDPVNAHLFALRSAALLIPGCTISLYCVGSLLAITTKSAPAAAA